VAGLEVFYPGRFGDAADPSHDFLATGSTATVANITNHIHGINGIRVSFDNIVTFATTPAAAFAFEWTTGVGTTFSAATSVSTSVSVTDTVLGGVTVVDIVLNDDYVVKRWLKVTIIASQVSTSGVALDGELSGNPINLLSGDGTPGGNAVFFIGNASGDVNGDRKTSVTDAGLVRAQVNPFLPVSIANVYDVDKSGKVVVTDAGEARADVNPFFTLPLISP